MRSLLVKPRAGTAGGKLRTRALECYRCGSVISRRTVDSLGRTGAFALAGLILYVPANIYPIIRMDYHGVYSESTVWDGCVTLFQDGEWLVAGIVFLASIVVPVFKLPGLAFLVGTVKFESLRCRHERTWTYNIIDVIGPWAMLDVFLLSILVGLVKLAGGIAFATADNPSDTPAKNGMGFALYDEPMKEWLEWTPKIPIPVQPN